MKGVNLSVVPRLQARKSFGLSVRASLSPSSGVTARFSVRILLGGTCAAANAFTSAPLADTWIQPVCIRLTSSALTVALANMSGVYTTHDVVMVVCSFIAALESNVIDGPRYASRNKSLSGFASLRVDHGELGAPATTPACQASTARRRLF